MARQAPAGGQSRSTLSSLFTAPIAVAQSGQAVGMTPLTSGKRDGHTACPALIALARTLHDPFEPELDPQRSNKYATTAGPNRNGSRTNPQEPGGNSVTADSTTSAVLIAAIANSVRCELNIFLKMAARAITQGMTTSNFEEFAMRSE